VHSHDGSRASREADIDVAMDAESRRQSVAAGEADSAVGIAHKVYITLSHAMRSLSITVTYLTTLTDLPVE
jgi:hypothetical protein